LEDVLSEPKKYKYERREDAEAWIRSSRQLAKSVAMLLRQDADNIFVDKHKIDVLGAAIWKLTEAETEKHNTRYCSEAVWKTRDLLTGKVQHEHVYSKEKMIINLLNCDESEIEWIIEKAVGCVVYKTEHDKLPRWSKHREEIDGWIRYKQAMIRVVDSVNTTDPEHPYFVPETL
jgi:hypothetical protein